MRSVAVVLCTLSTLPLLTLPAPAAEASGPAFDPGERAIVRAINRMRARYGVHAVRPNGALARAADAHSAEMLARGYFDHGAFAQRIRRYTQLRHVGETLAMTPRCNAGRTVTMWMNSASHRRVLLRGRLYKVGVGRRAGRMGSSRMCMVTADFGSRR